MGYIDSYMDCWTGNGWKVRHAQGIHNVAIEKGELTSLSDELFDARLSPLGIQQVRMIYIYITRFDKLRCPPVYKCESISISSILKEYFMRKK